MRSVKGPINYTYVSDSTPVLSPGQPSRNLCTQQVGCIHAATCEDLPCWTDGWFCQLRAADACNQSSLHHICPPGRPSQGRLSFPCCSLWRARGKSISLGPRISKGTFLPYFSGRLLVSEPLGSCEYQSLVKDTKNLRGEACRELSYFSKLPYPGWIGLTL